MMIAGAFHDGQIQGPAICLRVAFNGSESACLRHSVVRDEPENGIHKSGLEGRFSLSFFLSRACGF